MQDISKINILTRSNDTNARYEISKRDYQNKFIRLKKITLSNMDDEKKYEELKAGSKLLVTSLAEDIDTINYIIEGNKHSSSINILYSEDSKNTAKTKVRAAYRGVSFEEVSIKEDFLKELKCQAMITGIPLIDKEEPCEFSYDAFIKTMIGTNFALKVSITSIRKSYIDDIYEKLLKEKSKNSNDILVSTNTSTAESNGDSAREGKNETNNTGGGIGFLNKQEGVSTSSDITYTTNKMLTTAATYENTNFFSKEYDEILDNHIRRIKNMKDTKGFETSIIIYAENEELLKRGIDSYKAAFTDKVLERFNIHIMDESIPLLNNARIRRKESLNNILYGFIPECINLYTIDELATIINPSWDEVNGFNVVKRPRFTQQCYEKKDIYIGNILSYEEDTGIEFSLGQNDFNKHVLVAGITGSGKTNTVFSLIRDVNVPFLVIEPAKTEYRKLKSFVSDLRVYTLGREQVSPFRINPFKFESQNISLQEHIDNIKVIFTAAFTMYASMPNILEQCLVNIYTKKGWSLVTSKNVFCKDEIYEELYPTIEDLYTEIDNYINSLGYAAEQNQNIKAALLTRIKSMMTASKGFMLNTNKSIDIGELIKHPTVLELEGIADDEEKALIIGFIMLNIYEYLKSQDNGGTNDLKHLIIMEEAHRIFSNVSSTENQEMVNTKGKSVETLSNILCEIRAYGEGFIIVDQVPTKLAPDVLKNTNVKIIHRLVSKDDCEYISKSIQIKDEDIDFISRLKVGEALTYCDSLEDTAHIKINFNKDKYKHYSNKDVHDFCMEYNEEIFASNEVHPLAETLLTYDSIKSDIFTVTKKLLEKCFKEYINELTRIYNEGCKEYLDIAYKSGFEVEENYNRFVDDLIRKSVKIIVNESKFSNNVIKNTFVNKFMEAFVHLAKVDKNLNEKAYKALDKARQANYIDIKVVL